MFSMLHALLAIAIIIIVATLLLYRRITYFTYSRACKTWPFAMGRIIAAPCSAEEPARPFRFGSGGAGLDVRYTYSVHGKEYEGNNVSFDIEVRKSPTLARRIAALFEAGEEVSVYYDPKNPGISVLKP